MRPGRLEKQPPTSNNNNNKQRDATQHLPPPRSQDERMPPKGKKKRAQGKQPDGSGRKDASSNSSSSKRSKPSEVREKDNTTNDNAGASTNRINQTMKNSGTSAAGSKISAHGSTASGVHRNQDASSTISRKKNVAMATIVTSAIDHGWSAATTPPACSLYQQQKTLTSTTSTGRTSGNSSRVNLSPLAIPANVIQRDSRQGVDETSLVTENNSVLYNQELWDTKRENEYRMSQLKEYVRNDLFPAWKFFSSKKQMVFSNKPGGIVLKICNDLKVHNDHLMYWWDTHKKNILDALNRKRNDVTSYLKKRFCGTSYLLFPL